MIKAALNRERALVGVVGKLDIHARGRVGQDERFADFEVLDDECAAFKQLHARFEDKLHEARRREDDVAVHLVIFEKRHVAGIEPGGPGRRRSRQTNVEQPAPARSEAAFAPVARFMPPAAFVPRVRGQREQPARGSHRRKIQRDAGKLEIHRGFDQRLLLPLATHRRQH